MKKTSQQKAIARDNKRRVMKNDTKAFSTQSKREKKAEFFEKKNTQFSHTSICRGCEGVGSYKRDNGFTAVCDKCCQHLLGFKTIHLVVKDDVESEKQGKLVNVLEQRLTCLRGCGYVKNPKEEVAKLLKDYREKKNGK